MLHGPRLFLGRFDAHAVAFLLGVLGWLIPGSIVEIWEATVCPAAAGTVAEATCASDQIGVWLVVGISSAMAVGALCGRLASAKAHPVALLLTSAVGLMTVVLAFEVVVLVLLPSFIVGFAIGYRSLSAHRKLGAGR